MTDSDKPKTGAESIFWDLSDLYNGPDDPQLVLDLQATKAQADRFAQNYRGRVASLKAGELAQALADFEAIIILLSKTGAYVRLAWSTDTLDPTFGQLVARQDEHAVEIQQTILFFELEWANAPETVGHLADHPALANYSHYLKMERLYQPYTRSEPEEKIMSQLALSGTQGWVRYFSEVVSRLDCQLDGETLTFTEVLPLLEHPDRERRRKAADAITKTLNDQSHTSAFVFNMVLLEKASVDKIRGYESWVTHRNLQNQVDDATVDALVSAVVSQYDIVRRYNRLLQQQLGYDQLYDYDRYAPIAKTEVTVPWDEARQTVLDAFAGFDPRLAELAQQFFDKNWIDAPPKKGKRNGAYCAPIGAAFHPYVFLNYTGNMGDVMTLAHELGHGIHGSLSRQQSQLQYHTPLTTAEMASTFGEMLVFDHLVQQQKDPQVRFAMRMRKMKSTIGTAFRQIALNRFEDAIHVARRGEGEITIEQMSDLWMETQGQMFGDSVVLRDEYRIWWSYIHHFLAVPGYVYGYAFGELLVWALYALYKQNPDGFADRYLDVLSAGGSDWPHHILAPMGVDLQDPGFWHAGLKLLEQFVADMEADAANLKAE